MKFTPKCATALSKYKTLLTYNGTASNISGDTMAKASCWRHVQKIYWDNALKPTAMFEIARSGSKPTEGKRCRSSSGLKQLTYLNVQDCDLAIDALPALKQINHCMNCKY